MKCLNCGQEIEKGKVYCPSCGKEVQIVPDYNEFEEDYLKQIFDEANSKEKETESSEEDLKKAELAAKEDKEKKKKIILVATIAGGFVLTFLIVFTIVFSVKRSHANSYDYQLKLADQAYEEQDYDKALDYYEKALELWEKQYDGYNIDIRLTIMNIYKTLGDDDSVIYWAQEIIRCTQGNYDAYAAMIEIYEKQGDTDTIVQLYQDLISDPNYSADSKILALFDDYVVVGPEFDPEEGKYDEFISVTLTSSKGNQIYYTTDGSDPIENGSLYQSPIELSELGETTIKAVCKNDLGIYSDVVEKTYDIDIDAPDMPTVTPDGGDFTTETTVVVNIPENCICYYTWDGTDPTAYSDQTTGTIDVPEGNNVLSIMFVDNRTQLSSDIYRGRFSYYPD